MARKKVEAVLPGSLVTLNRWGSVFVNDDPLDGEAFDPSLTEGNLFVVACYNPPWSPEVMAGEKCVLTVLGPFGVGYMYAEASTLVDAPEARPATTHAPAPTRTRGGSITRPVSASRDNASGVHPSAHPCPRGHARDEG